MNLSCIVISSYFQSVRVLDVGCLKALAVIIWWPSVEDGRPVLFIGSGEIGMR